MVDHYVEMIEEDIAKIETILRNPRFIHALMADIAKDPQHEG